MSAGVVIVLVQPWVVATDALRARLTAAGIAATIAQVDFEAALEAALARQRVDVVVYAGATATLAREAVERCVRAHRATLPVIELDEAAIDAIARIARAASS